MAPSKKLSSSDLIRRSWAESRRRNDKRNSQEKVAYFPEYRGRELEFAKEILGEKHWAAQRLIFEQLFQHGKVTARTSHGIGKTRTAASIVLTFLMTRKDSVVVTTAPTDHQVRNLLWGEIGRLHANANADLPGSPDQKQLRLGPKWYALGLSTNKPARFQGFHGSVDVPHDPDDDIDPDEHQKALEDLAALDPEKIGQGGILLVFDEGAGIDQAIYDAAKGALTSPDSYVLYIGNPDLDIATAHEFVRSHRIDSEFFRVRVGAEPGPEDPFEPAEGTESRKTFASFDKVPNWLMDEAWIEERKRDYGVGTPLYYSKIWGMFAGSDASSRVMPLELLLMCEQTEEGVSIGAHIGVDPAADGGDESVATLVVDGIVRSQHAWRPKPQDKSALMSVVTMVEGLRSHWGKSLRDLEGFATIDEAIPWQHVHIEVNGIGAGVCDRMRQKGYMIDRVDMGSKAKGDWKDVTGDVKFLNRRAELHWAMRRLADEGMFSIDSELFKDAWAQAQWAEYEHRESGGGTTLVIQPKKEIKKQFGRSPDHWDSVLLAFSRSRKLRFTRRW